MMRRLRVMWLHMSLYCIETLSNSSNAEKGSSVCVKKRQQTDLKQQEETEDARASSHKGTRLHREQQHKFLCSSRYVYIQLLYQFNYQFNQMYKINMITNTSQAICSKKTVAFS